MKTYKNVATGEIWTKEEIRESYEQLKEREEIEGYETFEEYLEHLEDLGRDGYGIVAAEWYAVMKDKEDSDWGTGSFEIEEAKKMAVSMGPEAYIAVIEEGEDPICIRTIEQEDFEDL